MVTVCQRLAVLIYSHVEMYRCLIAVFIINKLHLFQMLIILLKHITSLHLLHVCVIACFYVVITLC